MYHAVQVAASDRPMKTTTRQMLGHFRKAQVPPKRIVREFPVTPDAHIPVGKSLEVLVLEHSLRITKGQHCLQFILYLANLWMLLPIRECMLIASEFYSNHFSIGKGFQGGMKRWGFHGLAASHGVSVSHRSSGSTGQHQVHLS